MGFSAINCLKVLNNRFWRYAVCFFLTFAVLSVSSDAFSNPVKEIFEKAMLALSEGDYENAIRLYEDTLKLYPQFAPAYNFMAVAYKESGGDLNKIIALFDKAVAIDPDYVLSYDNLGKLYYNLGKFGLAEENCLKAVALSPDLPSPKMSLGWIYLLGLSKPEEAIKYFKDVAESEKLPYAYFGLGIAYYMNEERLLMMDVITRLRDIKEEDFAKQLEAMVRTGRYIPPIINGIPLIAPPKAKDVIIHDETPSLADVKPLENMPVRVRKKLPALRSIENNPQKGISGADRIRQLQNNQPSR